jgi:hypothetical protein
VARKDDLAKNDVEKGVGHLLPAPCRVAKGLSLMGAALWNLFIERSGLAVFAAPLLLSACSVVGTRENMIINAVGGLLHEVGSLLCDFAIPSSLLGGQRKTPIVSPSASIMGLGLLQYQGLEGICSTR